MNKAIRKKFDIIKLHQPAIKTQFSLKLRNKYDILQDYDETDDDEVEKQWQDFEDLFYEKVVEWAATLYIMFVDFKKAFD